MFINLFISSCLIVCLTAGEPPCKTPIGEDGTCISIYKCLELVDVLATLNDTQIKFAKKYQCGYERYPLVCCPTRGTKPSSNTTQQDPLMNRQYCGYQHVDDYVTGKNGSMANIDEFPWMAGLLLFTQPNLTRVGCSGALISDQYVLTAAHCVILRDDTLVGVRLGEYNTKLDKDCSDNSENEDCTDPIEEYGIETSIVHPAYSIRTKSNDIALLKLNRTVTFSDFIRPICLPFPGTKLARHGDIMTLSGWGLASFGKDPVNIKKKVLMRLAPIEECIRHYSKYVRNVITNRHMCTKPTADKHDVSCQGDSGGPVMFASKSQWHVEGIISYGVICGTDLPDVNTNVVSYLDWIVENIKS